MPIIIKNLIYFRGRFKGFGLKIRLSIFNSIFRNLIQF